jgi:hypothetical protein
MWPYRIFSNAYASMPTQKKSYKHIMLSSQHRNTNGSKLHLCKHANAFASVVEAVQEPTAQQSGVSFETRPIYFYAISFQSVNGKACRQYGAIAVFYLKQVQHSVLKPPQSLRSKCSYG